MVKDLHYAIFESTTPAERAIFNHSDGIRLEFHALSATFEAFINVSVFSCRQVILLGTASPCTTKICLLEIFSVFRHQIKRCVFQRFRLIIQSSCWQITTLTWRTRRTLTSVHTADGPKSSMRIEMIIISGIILAWVEDNERIQVMRRNRFCQHSARRTLMVPVITDGEAPYLAGCYRSLKLCVSADRRIRVGAEVWVSLKLGRRIPPALSSFSYAIDWTFKVLNRIQFSYTP